MLYRVCIASSDFNQVVIREYFPICRQWKMSSAECLYAKIFKRLNVIGEYYACTGEEIKYLNNQQI